MITHLPEDKCRRRRWRRGRNWEGEEEEEYAFLLPNPTLKTMLPGMTREETALAVRNGTASPSPFQTSLVDHTLPS